jgi:exodeoxyribonuclease-5
MTLADQVIVGLNRTRRRLNVQHRRLLGTESPWPVGGDKVVCLRNDRELGLFNGSMWRVQSAEVSPDESTIALDLGGDERPSRDLSVRSWAHHFSGREQLLDDLGFGRIEHAEFDWGYNITCHKAQGSQWDDVVLVDESRSFDASTARRWLYTGVTRAAKRLLLVV